MFRYNEWVKPYIHLKSTIKSAQISEKNNNDNDLSLVVALLWWAGVAEQGVAASSSMGQSPPAALTRTLNAS